MKNWTITAQMHAFGVFSVLMLLVLAGGAYWTIGRLNTAADSSAVIQRQMHADMMHNAIRGDAMSALYSALARVPTQENFLENIQTNSKALQDDLAFVAKHAQKHPGGAIAAHVQAVGPMVERYASTAQSLVQEAQYLEKHPALLKIFEDDFSALEEKLTQMADELVKAAQNQQAQALAAKQLAIYLIVGMLGLGLALIVPIVFFIQRNVLQPLQGMVRTIETIEKEHNLDLRVQADGDNEIAQAMRAFNALVANMQTVVKGVTEAAVELLQCSKGLSQSASQTSQLARQNSQATTQVAAAMKELFGSVSEISMQAEFAKQFAQRLYGLSQQSFFELSTAKEHIAEVSDVVQTSSSHMGNLEKHTQSISQITSVIQEITAQTNLLALNAAIEAARAGEDGRGFAVVADEVRNLAERTGESTQKISGMVDSIQNGTRTAVAALGTGVGKVQHGTSSTAMVAEILGQVKDCSAQAVQAVEHISACLKAQEAVAKEVAAAVEQVFAGNERNQQMANQTAQQAQDVGAQAQRLLAQVAHFVV